jgi:GntR family transcriptional regulator/MocR family aminotransferase
MGFHRHIIAGMFYKRQTLKITVSLHPPIDAVSYIFKDAGMIPVIDTRKTKPLYEQIYQFYKEAILNNQLKHNQRLSPHRVLAKELGVGNNTVIRAYEQLVLEGYVRNEKRRGLFVAEIERRLPVRKSPANSAGTRSPAVARKQKGFAPSLYMVDEDNFPIRQWRKCSNRALDSISFQYEEHERNDGLKEQLIKYLFEHRGVRASQERLIVGSGATSLLFWLGFVLRRKCSRIAVEEPGYTRVTTIFSELDFNVIPVSVRQDGMDVNQLINTKTDLVYLTPSHQYPTGATMPVNNRIQILNWASRNNVYILEDDFDCEFRHKTNVMPSLQALDQRDRVIYIGSFSNSLMPSLRVGYLALPAGFDVPYQSFTFLTNTVPYLTRKTLAIFMEEGFWERHLKKMKLLYQKKHALCIEALSRLPGKFIDFRPTPSGLNILLSIRSRLTETELIQRALDDGIVVAGARQCYHNKRSRKAHPEVLFEFGSIPEDKIETIIGRLFSAWFPER